MLLLVGIYRLGASGANDVDCTNRPYVMSSPPRTPTTTDPDVTFSSCSAQAIKTYLENADIPECLYSTEITETDFLERFCKGRLGYLENSVDRQCQLQRQWIGSTPCYLENEPEGYVHRCAYDPQLRRLPLYCKNRQGNLCYGQTVVYDGTPCTPAGTTFTDRVCYRGECVQAFELCPAEIQVQQRASRWPYRARGPARPSNRQPACSRGGY